MNTYNIIADKMVFGGNCLSKINGKNVFIPFSIPGEELEIEIVKEKSDYDVARIVKILTPSEYRVFPPCKYYQNCGGCNMMHIETNAQVSIRKQMLCEVFERCGLKDIPIEVVSADSFGYRCRFQFHDGGLEQRSSNNVIPIDNCLVAEDEVNDWLKKNPFNQRPKGKSHVFASSKVVSAAGIIGNKVAVSVEVLKKNDFNFSLASRKKKFKESRKIYSGTILSPKDSVTVNILGKNITFDSRGFFQSNLNVLEKAVQLVCNGLKGSSVLDMYSGCGTFSVFLADIFENVTLVEHNRDAIVYAEQNLTGKNHKSFGLSGAKWALSYSDSKFDAVVVDPPRSGMEKEVLEYLCKAKIPMIRSVSCDPATHARDALKLVQAGYKLEKLYMLDFYPNTSHIESLAYFVYE